MTDDGATIQELANRKGVSRPYFSSVLRLKFPAPDIVDAIIRAE